MHTVPLKLFTFQNTVRVDGDIERNTGAGEEFFVYICHGKSYSLSLANTMPIMPEMLDLVAPSDLCLEPISLLP